MRRSKSKRNRTKLKSTIKFASKSDIKQVKSKDGKEEPKEKVTKEEPVVEQTTEGKSSRKRKRRKQKSEGELVEGVRPEEEVQWFSGKAIQEEPTAETKI